MTSPWINYQHLFYFKTIAEEGSVSKAAEKLRLGQPTLSAQLKQLEDTLGVKLFDRQHKRLVLNEQGHVALTYAKTIFKTGNELLQVLHDRMRPSKPFLGIGAIDSVPKQVVVQMAEAAYRFAACQISLIEGRPEELLRELTSHRIDVMLSDFLPTRDTRGLHYRVLSKKNVCVYGAPRFKSLTKDFPKSLSGVPVIVPTYDSKLRDDVEHWAQLHGIQLEIIAESQDVSMKELMAVHSLGLITAATHTVTRQVLEGSLIQIGVMEGVFAELFLVSAQRKISNPHAVHLMKSFSI